MKAAIYKEPCEISFEELALPSLLDEEVLIRVAFAVYVEQIFIYILGIIGRYLQWLLVMNFPEKIVALKTKQNLDFKIGDRVVVRPTIYCNKCYACQRGYKNVCKDLTMIGIDYPGAFAEYLLIWYIRYRKELV